MPPETLFGVNLVYNPDVPVSPHPYRLTVGLVRDEAYVFAGVEAIVEHDAVER